MGGGGFGGGRPSGGSGGVPWWVLQQHQQLDSRQGLLDSVRVNINRGAHDVTREIERAAANVQRNFEYHDRRLRAVERMVENMNYERQLDAFKDSVREGYRSAHGYTTVVMTVGYAGYFALLAAVKSHLSLQQQNWSVLLAAMSLAAFVVWEVGGMIANSLHAQRLEELLGADEPPSQKQIAAEVDQHHRRIMMWWPPVLAFTLLTAMAGVAVLAYGFFATATFT